jgi:hypothetical protein
MNGDKNKVEVLIKQGISVNLKAGAEYDGNTALIECIKF